ncbi:MULTISPECIES: hypothetical protein [unclassified Frankia]|uniref:hypothetical protein n=1 Tax=unclassified Frankia TaxID=2632575 RepID=UPI00202536E8
MVWRTVPLPARCLAARSAFARGVTLTGRAAPIGAAGATAAPPLPGPGASGTRPRARPVERRWREVL